MNEGYAPQNPEFWGFSKFERLFFLSEFDWIRFNLHRSASIYIDPHRSTLICLDLNLKISSIFRIYQDFDSLFTFHMGEVNNWPLRRQSDSVGLGNFSKKFVCSFSCYFQGLFFVLIRIFIEDFSFFLNEKLRKMLFLQKKFPRWREKRRAPVCRPCILINFEKVHQKIFRALRAQRALHYIYKLHTVFHKKRDICLPWKKLFISSFIFVLWRKYNRKLKQTSPIIIRSTRICGTLDQWNMEIIELS